MFNKCCYNRNMGCCMPQMEQQIVEPPINKCIEKEFYHEVPQDCFFMIEKKNSLYKNILFIMKLIY